MTDWTDSWWFTLAMWLLGVGGLLGIVYTFLALFLGWYQ